MALTDWHSLQLSTVPAVEAFERDLIIGAIFDVTNVESEETFVMRVDGDFERDGRTGPISLDDLAAIVEFAAFQMVASISASNGVAADAGAPAEPGVHRVELHEHAASAALVAFPGAARWRLVAGGEVQLEILRRVLVEGRHVARVYIAAFESAAWWGVDQTSVSDAAAELASHYDPQRCGDDHGTLIHRLTANHGYDITITSRVYIYIYISWLLLFLPLFDRLDMRSDSAIIVMTV